MRDKIAPAHCVKSVRIRSSSGPYFPAFGLNTERYSVAGKYGPEKLRIRTLFTQWHSLNLVIVGRPVELWKIMSFPRD